MEKRIVTFELSAIEPHFFLHDLGVETMDYGRSEECNPCREISVGHDCYVSLKQAVLVWRLNMLVDEYKLTIFSISPTEGGAQIWAKTSEWRRFRFNWRRIYERNITVDFCPRCFWDVSQSDERCKNCGSDLVWLSGGVVLR